jgi:hypothetical protein
LIRLISSLRNSRARTRIAAGSSRIRIEAFELDEASVPRMPSHIGSP